MQIPLSLQQATQEYLENLTSQGKSPNTLHGYGQDLKQVVAYFGAKRDLKSILKIHVGKFYKSPTLLNKADGTPRAGISLARIIRVFRMFVLWAKEQGYIEDLPLTKDTPMGRASTLVKQVSVDTACSIVHLE